MTVTPTSYTPDIYNGNGSTTAFAVTFPFYTILETHIDSAGSETAWAETTNYTVAGGSGSTGTVTALVAPASGEQLRIERVTVKSQAEDFDFDNQVTEDSLQNAVDKLAMIMQEQNYDNLRRPAISVANYTSPVEFPAASTGSVLSWDGSGNIANTALVDLDGVAISALTTVSSLENTDLFPLYDTSAGGNKSVTLANLITAVAPTIGALAALDTVDTAQIDADAVTTAKIIDDAVTTAKILDGNVTAAKLASGILPDISYKQVQETLYTTQSTLSSISAWTDTGLTLNITPSASDSVVEVDLSIMAQSHYGGGSNGMGVLRLVRVDSAVETVIANGFGMAFYTPSAEVGTGNSAVVVTDSPASTNALTYKVQVKPRSGSNSIYINRTQASTSPDTFCSTLRLKERLA